MSDATFDAVILHCHPGLRFRNRLEVTFLAHGREWDAYVWTTRPDGTNHYQGQLIGSLLKELAKSRARVTLQTMETEVGTKITGALKVEAPVVRPFAVVR